MMTAPSLPCCRAASRFICSTAAPASATRSPRRAEPWRSRRTAPTVSSPARTRRRPASPPSPAGRRLRFPIPASSSVAPQYVSPEITGYEDLQIYGTWLPVPEYGVLWMPRQVPVTWAPYREGHWRWVPPWGWTWIDDQKWGFAPFHYGRWVNVGGIWGWLPGPATDGQPPAYAPALVTFVAAPDATIPEAAPIAWAPLAPGEIYQPAAAAQAPDAGPSLVGLSFVYFARLNPGARHEVLAAFGQDGAFRQRPPAGGRWRKAPS